MKRRVMLVGLGDLGMRLAHSLAAEPEVEELVLVARDPDRGAANAALIADCSEGTRIRLEIAGGPDRRRFETLLRREKPDLIVQCASLLSPWVLPQRQDPVSAALLAAGFGAQLPAQLPVVHALMEAVRETGHDIPVINCSFPDLTHPVLAKRGLAPAIGTGNASMIWRRVRSALRRRGAPDPPLVRVLAHHAHVTGCILSRPEASRPGPRVFLGDEARRADHLAYEADPLRSDPGLNALSAASAMPVIRAFSSGRLTRISAPGPLGLPGGYPVVIEDGRISLDLPDGTSIEEAIRFQETCARQDGVERIEPDGTVVFTDEFASRVRPFDPVLAEPLAPAGAASRFERLCGLLEL